MECGSSPEGGTSPSGLHHLNFGGGVSANFHHVMVTTLPPEVSCVSIGFRGSPIVSLVGSETLSVLHRLPTQESAALLRRLFPLVSLLKHDSSRVIPCLVKGRAVPTMGNPQVAHMQHIYAHRTLIKRYAATSQARSLVQELELSPLKIATSMAHGYPLARKILTGQTAPRLH
jgi:hypothetical protein